MNGSDYVWESQRVDNENQFLALFTRRLLRTNIYKTGLNV